MSPEPPDYYGNALEEAVMSKRENPELVAALSAFIAEALVDVLAVLDKPKLPRP